MAKLLAAGGGTGGTVGAVAGSILTSTTDWGHHVGVLAVFFLRQHYPDLPDDAAGAVEGLASGLTALAISGAGVMIGAWFSREQPQ